MASSKIAICSAARVALGQSTINSFDEDTSGLCSAWWDIVRQATLRLGVWSCARTRVNLAPLATAPAFEWAYQFQIPTDCLRILSLGEREEFPEHEIENGKILCDDSAIKLRYIFDNAEVSTWDAILVEAVTCHMAWIMAYKITGSNTIRDSFKDQFAQILVVGRGVNSSEAPADRMGDHPILLARRSR